MSNKYRNIFLAIGVLAVVVMLCTFDMSYTVVWAGIRRAGYWFPACVALWLVIYMMNALGWRAIINDGSVRPLGYWRILKYTITGFALNNVTPVGLLGGEPYRIMELTPLVGAAKATSSVLLNSMMHIFSHFCFWVFSIVLYLVLYGRTMGVGMGVLLLACSLFCGLGVYFFLRGYRDGLAMRALCFFGRWPFIGPRIRRFTSTHEETIDNVDRQIAQLHAERPGAFYFSLAMEFLARMLGCFELQFILFILTPDVSYWDCVLMQAFTSLVANLLFIIPMQMGTREGGLAIVTDSLHMSGGYGVLTGLITRLRELIWVAIGLVLMKVNNKVLLSSNPSK